MEKLTKKELSLNLYIMTHFIKANKELIEEKEKLSISYENFEQINFIKELQKDTKKLYEKMAKLLKEEI